VPEHVGDRSAQRRVGLDQPLVELPIRIEQTITGPGRSVAVSLFKDFRFDVELDDSLFDIEPPEGYTVRKKPAE
jgi:hypothetical protein